MSQSYLWVITYDPGVYSKANASVCYILYMMISCISFSEYSVESISPPTLKLQLFFFFIKTNNWCYYTHGQWSTLFISMHYLWYMANIGFIMHDTRSISKQHVMVWHLKGEKCCLGNNWLDTSSIEWVDRCTQPIVLQCAINVCNKKKHSWYNRSGTLSKSNISLLHNSWQLKGLLMVDWFIFLKH